MSYVKKSSFFEQLTSITSLKRFSSKNETFKKTKLGQKLFLYNEKLPRVINISFHEKTCFFACKMCPYAENEVRDLYKKESIMSFETLKNIVKSIPNDSYYSFDISAIGETLQFKNLAKFIKYMKINKPQVNTIISTNAALLTEKVFIDLSNAGLDSLQISLFAGNKADHEYITKSKLYNKVRENVINCWHIKKEKKLQKPFIQTFMIDSKDTSEKAKEFLKEWTKYVDHCFIRPMYNVGREIKGMEKNFEYSSERYPCIHPWYSTAIKSNGDVLPCYMFHWSSPAKEETIGNINKNSLKEIWSSEKFKKFREDHLKIKLSDYPVCQKCDTWDSYTNIWQKERNGSFKVKKLSSFELFQRVYDFRGG